MLAKNFCKQTTFPGDTLSTDSHAMRFCPCYFLIQFIRFVWLSVTSPPPVAHHFHLRLVRGNFLTTTLRGLSQNPAARCSAYRREMPRRNASLCDLPVEVVALVLSHIEHVKTRQTLQAMSSTFQEASSLPGALLSDNDGCSRQNPAARCSTYRREMPRRNASLCDLPVELVALVLSHIEHVKTRQTLEAMSIVFV